MARFNCHRPYHLFVPGAMQFVTARTYLGRPHFNEKHDMAMLRDYLMEGFRRYDWEPRAWVVLPDHYHFLAASETDGDVGRLAKWVHARTAERIMKRHPTAGKKIWYQYWDELMRSEGELLIRFNYIHRNPIKHGYVENPEDWEFSSYRKYLHTDPEWLLNTDRLYSVDRLDFENPKKQR